MAKPVSAGLLLYRATEAGVSVLLVHPSGAYNRKAPWSIPKGLAEESESWEETARRETIEETGVTADAVTPIGTIEYRKSRKTIAAFAGPAPEAAAPRCASWEVDRAEFLPLAEAREVLHPDQRVFLDRLVALLSAEHTPDP
jgi:predicted NUDIX family NTP pyrophosphohydrolase